MQSSGAACAANQSIGPSARKGRGPQADKDLIRDLPGARKRLAQVHVRYDRQPEYALTIAWFALSGRRVSEVGASAPNHHGAPLLSTT